MIRILTLLLIVVLLFGCNHKQNSDNETYKPTPANDTLLARQLGADQYGMKQYVMAFLKRGPNQQLDSAQSATLFRAHLDNINRLANEGKLIIAGPFLDNGNIRGIYIFDVKTVDEAEELTNTDPAIKAGRLVMELHPWYGSAALMKVNEIHNQIAKEKI